MHQRLLFTQLRALVVKYIAPAPAVVAATTALVEYIALATAVVAYAAPAPVMDRSTCSRDRSTYAGGGEHRALLAVSVVPEPTVCAAPTPVAKSFRCVCRVRGAGIRSVCSARTSGGVLFAISVSIEAPELAVCAALAPVAEYIREAWRQLQAAETLRRHYCILLLRQQKGAEDS